MNMKATGIVRRIDDLGRVVIPKEIRRTMRIRESEPLEIYTCDGAVIFRKYNATPQRDNAAQEWLQQNKARMDSQSVRFSIDGDVTTCDGILNNRRVIGTAKRNPEDAYAPAVGMVYAYCRAFNVMIPDDLE